MKNLVFNPRGVSQGEVWTRGGQIPARAYRITMGVPFDQQLVPYVEHGAKMTIVDAAPVENAYLRPATVYTAPHVAPGAGRLHFGCVVRFPRDATLRLILQFYNSAGEYVTSAGVTHVQVRGGEDTWVTTSGIVPANAAMCRPYVGQFQFDGETGEEWLMTAALLVQSDAITSLSPDDYFDGHSPAGGVHVLLAK